MFAIPYLRMFLDHQPADVREEEATLAEVFIIMSNFTDQHSNINVLRACVISGLIDRHAVPVVRIGVAVDPFVMHTMITTPIDYVMLKDIS